MGFSPDYSVDIYVYQLLPLFAKQYFNAIIFKLCKAVGAKAGEYALLDPQLESWG